MKILLIQVPTSHSGAGEIVYPLGLSRLASLIPDHYKKSALDMNLFPDPWPELKNRLERFKPDIVAMSFRNIDPLAGIQSSYLSSLKTSAKLARKIVPDAIITAGGPAFTLFAERLLNEIPEIDCGLIGEGEAVFSKLIESPIESPGKPESVPGLIWRKDGKIIKNPQATPIDMDLLPAVDHKCFCPEDYIKKNKYIASIGIEGKRGCDLSCGYCMYPLLGGNGLRLRSPEIIVDEMEWFQKEYGISLFHFTDSVVNRPLDHFESLCNEIVNRKLNVTWTGFFREDTFTEASADLASRAGLAACYFSADALTEHGLNLLNKKMTKDDILDASRITVENDILTMCHFLVNLPFESQAHRQESRDMMQKILEIHAPKGNLGAVIFNTVRLYPNASLTKKLLTKGLLNPDADLLYPVYHNPVETSHVLHELESMCHSAGVFSRLDLSL